MKTIHCLLAVGLVVLGLLMVACSTETRQSAEVGKQTDLPASGTTTAVAAGDLPATVSPPTPSLVPSPTAQSTIEPVSSPSLPDLGPAPDFTNEVWLNTDRPLNLELLQGEVVLVEFWTFG